MRAITGVGRGFAAVAVVLALGLSACSATPAVEADIPPQTQAQLPEDTTVQLQDAVTHAMAASGASGALVGVWAPWSGEWVVGLGTQEVGGGAEVTTDLRFRAGRITRAMTCDALHVLAADGTVSLKDPVTAYVTGVAELEDVTLGQLCDGTSGMGSYAPQLLETWLAVPHREWAARELASYGVGQPRDQKPGTAYRDSDAGYVLLGLALERATGQTMPEILRTRVFAPLGLQNTVLPADGAAHLDGLIEGFYSLPDAEGVMNCTDPLRVTDMAASFGFADSGVVTDIHDLGRYVQALAAGALMPEKSSRFENPVPIYAGAPSWYNATGGVIQAGSLIGQFGAVPGYATAAFADPRSGLAVAVVLNNSGAGGDIAAYLAWELAAIASKAPVAEGETMPEAGLPWTAVQFRDATTAAAICPLPSDEPVEEPAEEG